MKRALPLFRGLLLAGYVAALALGSLLPRSYPVGLSRHDTELHFAAYAGLALLAGTALCPPRRLRWVLLAVGCYGLLMELMQSLIPGRHPSLEDFAANTCGIAAGGVCVLVWLRCWHTVRAGNGGAGARP